MEKEVIEEATKGCNYPKVDKESEGRISRFIRENRVFPRAYMVFWCLLCGKLTLWFIGQPEISMAQGAFLSVMVTAASAYGKFYSQHSPSEK